MKRLLLTTVVMLSLSAVASAQTKKAARADGSKASAGITPVQKAVAPTATVAPATATAPNVVIDKKTNRKVMVGTQPEPAAKAAPAAASSLVEAARVAPKN